MEELLTIKEASRWATEYLNKKVSVSNISYLLQYGRVRKSSNNGITLISKIDLKKYYSSFKGQRELDWKQKLGGDLNWALSFDYLREKDTTKHVHRLHPYKGKFIPQLVEYFLDNHTDDFKKEVFFKKGDIVLDPFCGSGTTLIQSNELGLHAVGIDISAFNALISNVKIRKYDLFKLSSQLKEITQSLKSFISKSNNIEFEKELLERLNEFNTKYFPSPAFKIKVRNKEINEREYSAEKEDEFLPVFHDLVKKYDLKIRQDRKNTFLEKWYLEPVRREIDFVFEKIKNVQDVSLRKILAVILSRTIRSCRATTHADLATLKEPVTSTYYCKKHGKICKPLFSILSWWQRYADDTLNRLYTFDQTRTNTFQYCLQGDSRNIDIFGALDEKFPAFCELAKNKKISGIFSSPPYVGLIDYHEQHAYAYELFGFERNDDLEIGPLAKGQSLKSRQEYIESISQVLINSKKYLVDDFNIFLVANDKYNMYPEIAEKAGLRIVGQYKRPVLNRTEKDKGAYSEIIFHLKEV